MRYLLKSRMALVAGLVFASLSAHAGWFDQQVDITKAADSRTLTVRYAGAKAALIELRINGTSAATRTVTDGQSSGEANFTLDTSKLSDGENKVEIRLYDAAGKVVGSQKTTVSIDRTASGPVFLNKPQSGATLQGMVEISVGFKYEMKGAYVSFFVNDEFKSLKNYAPYTFLWDTSKATNGWHEVEAWVVDANSATFKTQRLRVFVNNPNGRTERQGDPAGTNGSEPREATTPVVTKPAVVEAPKVAPKATTPLDTTQNSFDPVTSKATGTKSAVATHGVMTSQRVMRPTGNRVAGLAPTKGTATQPAVRIDAPTTPAKAVAHPIIEVKASDPRLVAKAEPVKATPAAANGKVNVSVGTKLPNIGYYPIFINGSAVNFDVMPRVTDGIALTPFRHLFEHVGGEVGWNNADKVVDAKGVGQKVEFKIGQDFATVNGSQVGFERASFLESGRAIVPLSFVQKLLNVEIQYDPGTKHVLISKVK